MEKRGATLKDEVFIQHSNLAVKPEQGSGCASVSSRGKNNHPFTALTIGIPA